MHTSLRLFNIAGLVGLCHIGPMTYNQLNRAMLLNGLKQTEAMLATIRSHYIWQMTVEEYQNVYLSLEEAVVISLEEARVKLDVARRQCAASEEDTQNLVDAFRRQVFKSTMPNARVVDFTRRDTSRIVFARPFVDSPRFDEDHEMLYRLKHS